MGKTEILEHMNSGHADFLQKLCKNFGNFTEVSDVKLMDFDDKGLDISCDVSGEKKSVRVPFLAPVQNGDIKKAIMDLSASLNYESDLDGISKKMIDFIDAQKSVIISSDLGEHCVASYSPFIREGETFYVLISEIPVHYKAIFANPQKVQILFLQDESAAKTIFARARVSFNVKATLNDEIRAEMIAKFRAKFPDESPLDMIEKMADFHIVKFEISKGRAVFGFGAAYDTNGLKVIARAGGKMPHSMPHK